MSGLATFLGAYGQSRRQKINKERDEEDRQRDTKLRVYQRAIDQADELGLTQDDLRIIFNDIGTALGHKPDPKLFGLLQVGDKGSKGKPDLGDLLFPQEKRDQPVITGSAPGQPLPANAPKQVKRIEDVIGPPPQMITSRKGDVPVRDLKLRAQREHQIMLDTARTQNEIQQANSIASRSIQSAIRPDGSVAFFRQELDPATGKVKLVDVTPEEGLRATQQVINEAKANKEFNEQLNLLKNDPKYADLPEEVLRATAAKNVMDLRKAELAKTEARAEELRASTQLKRARTDNILNPKLTPYQAASLGLRQQGLEIAAARTAIQQSYFEKSQSQNLIRDLDSFYKARNEALKTIGEGNEAQAKGDLVEANSKWRLGYMMLAQSKIMATSMQSHYQGMVNVANVDPSDGNQYPWVEVNFDLPAQNNPGVPKVKVGGKRQFTPSQKVAPEMIEKYRKWLESKGLTKEQVEEKVKQYASSGGK